MPVARAPTLALLLLFSLGLAVPSAAVAPSFIAFESGQVRPLALSPDESQLFVLNTPDNRLEIFDVDLSGNLTHTGSVTVGMEPVAVAARTNTEVWVVNLLSDSVSIVDLSGAAPRVIRTLLVGDEPRDIVFAGPGSNRAFISAAHRGQNHDRVTGHDDPTGEFGVPGTSRADVWVFDATSLGTSLWGDPLTVLGFFGDRPRALARSNDGSRVYVGVFRSGNQTSVVNAGLVCETSNSNFNNDVVQPRCTINGVDAAGGMATPHQNDGPGDPGSLPDRDQPQVGVIVKFNRDGGTSNTWQDEIKVCDSGPDQDDVCTTSGDCGGSGVCEPRDWSDAVKFSLPDRDVFEINANANPPAPIDGSSTCSDGSGCWAAVGTTLFNMVVNPISGNIYVSNTDAQNHVRFEGPGTYATGIKPAGEPTTVQGNLAQTRISVISGSTVTPRHLNKHINYATLPAPLGVSEDSLSMPLDMTITPDGQTLYVAAFGSNKIGVFDTTELENDTFTPDSADHIALAGGGPSGLALKGDRLYVLTRFDNTVRVIDRISFAEIEHHSLYNPEPSVVEDGRKFLYDATLTSSNGEAACASCHIFGHMDDLAWDLGNPDDDVRTNDNPFNPVIPLFADPLPRDFHPMKGPMTTQDLVGLKFMGAQHWRGDRQSDGDSNGREEIDAILGFEAFNVAFPGLVGRASELTANQMTAFREFALELSYPPNPLRELDNSLRADEQEGFDIFFGLGGVGNTDGVATCEGCHTLEASQGSFGGNGQLTFEGESQHFKVPHLRNMYQKVGMFGMGQPDNGSGGGALGGGAFQGDGDPFGDKGAQVRGFGFLHDGAVDTIFRFHSAVLFTLSDTQQTESEAFMMVFDSDLAPVVAQQVTLHAGNFSDSDTDDRIDLLEAQAATSFTSKLLGGAVTECDLIAAVSEDGAERGYLFAGSGLWDTDDGSPQITTTTLRDKANEGVCAGGSNDGTFCTTNAPCTGGGTCSKTQEVTFTCAPPGSGYRMALDRDEDNLLNGVETNDGNFVDPWATGSNPADPDTDGDGWNDGDEVAFGTDPNDPFDFPNLSEVPGLAPFGLGLLAAALLASGGMRRWRSSARLKR